MKNHYIQQALQKQFARFDGKNHWITLVDLEHKKIGSRKVESAFYEKGLYSDEVERELNRMIEAPGMKVFDKAYDSNGVVMLTRREVQTMQKYLLVQHYRNPTNISQYVPDFDNVAPTVNEDSEADMKAKQFVSEELHKICNSSWGSLLKNEDKELSFNALEIRNTMTLFVRSELLEFVFNDMGSVTERLSFPISDETQIKTNLESVLGGKIPTNVFHKKDDKIFFDNYTFHPISQHIGIVLLNPIWTRLIRKYNPYTPRPWTESQPLLYDLDPTFFERIEKTTGLCSEFLYRFFAPARPIYQSNRMRKVKTTRFRERLERNGSPNDKFLYPVVDLDLYGTQYLNNLTINEAKKFFAFGSIPDGKLSITTYGVYSALNGGKNDLNWVDLDADWTKPFN